MSGPSPAEISTAHNTGNCCPATVVLLVNAEFGDRVERESFTNSPCRRLPARLHETLSTFPRRCIMDAPLSYNRARQSKARRLPLCGGLVLLLATALLYLVVALRYSHAAPLPFSWAVPPAPVADANDSASGDTGDRFALHPELHVSRPPRTLKLDWSVTRQQHRPDGVLRDVYFINGIAHALAKSCCRTCTDDGARPVSWSDNRSALWRRAANNGNK